LGRYPFQDSSRFARLAAGRPFDFVELKEGIHSDAVCRPIKRPPWRLAGTFYEAVSLMTFYEFITCDRSVKSSE
ncbi:MAG: hypothetical protein V2B13_04315, partial [Pseudomonadota bacterium]